MGCLGNGKSRHTSTSESEIPTQKHIWATADMPDILKHYLTYTLKKQEMHINIMVETVNNNTIEMI
jgi:hypothetical protein